ncbi:S-layer structural protein [Methanocaldococcus jannaschii DSM 2661]|uniref:S-layer protein n=1 Tax=Methanocaldococcus jannaschii (strain ATCC 43067 / DSM 2661 / JAL-1 / JCM 10045 / NBRC 100440) TaxID=243232 RepID=CSG_METJA|nr:S-layer protein Sla [Methanocaldococcus jannaschii]Q58232.1 RecName: Full=S-layer protein; AltName: Full=Cell surface glycoprotein; AltName: Full=Surface layer protein; Flags: Precursor [Methanocaldococcus jannaschii DSM 2661]AAB98821.1 S-layer structural protein [Methanocaldococcus jannaschii DSM 2661]CAC84089.1 surface-layer protein [Methanocaldococcus jannaschii DSM 2661]
MAMSLKKIGAIAVGGAMVATALASGVAAEVTTSGFSDYKELKDILVKDGQPNCYVVVGADAPSTMDVVSAADIAAKIGSLCYKEGTVEDGSADITVHAEANSDDFDLKKDWNNSAMPANAYALFVAASDGDYSEKFENDTGKPSFMDNGVLGDADKINKTVDLGDIATMMKVDDVDPSDWYDSDDDAGEIVMVELKNDTSDGFTVYKKNMLYETLVYKDDEENFANTTKMEEGMRIPFLGKEMVVVDIDKDDDAIYLGTPVYDGIIKEGETYDLGNGYQVKIKAILKTTVNNTDVYKVDVQILKDGKVVAEKYDKAPLELEYKDDVGVTVHKAWENVGGDYGYAELVISKDLKKLELDEEYVTDWKAYAVLNDNGTMKLEDDLNDNNVDKVVGIALRYDGDKLDDLDSGDEVDILDYVKFKLDDEDSNDKLKVYFSMDKDVDATLNIGEKVKALNAEVKLKDIKANAVEPVSLTAPIAKLDTEVSLDTADKNLVLVGGPVANKLTKELVDAGKLALDNNSPATIALIPDAANGHDVIVVAGGDREKTREAALELIKNL